MLRKFKLLLVISYAFMLYGCSTQATSPTALNVDKSEVYEATYDQVWAAVIAGIAEANLPITTLEKDSGIIVVSGVSYDRDWANEGTRGSVLGVDDLVVERLANFNIMAIEISEEKTRLQLNSTFKMNVRSGNGSQMFPFQYRWQKSYSNGSLEKIMLDGIDARVKTIQEREMKNAAKSKENIAPS